MTPSSAKTVLLTGASGLLGRHLVAELLSRGLFVLAHYHSRPGPDHPRLVWVPGDFSDLAGVRRFLAECEGYLESCHYLLLNYGPMTYKETGALSGDDFLADLTGNVVVAAELIFHLLRRSPRLEAVTAVGYLEAGRTRAFKKILPYAVSKNALLDLIRSLDASFPAVRFNVVSPATLEGAAFARKGERGILPQTVAGRIAATLLGRSRGRHLRLGA